MHPYGHTDGFAGLTAKDLLQAPYLSLGLTAASGRPPLKAVAQVSTYNVDRDAKASFGVQQWKATC